MDPPSLFTSRTLSYATPSRKPLTLHAVPVTLKSIPSGETRRAPQGAITPLVIAVGPASWEQVAGHAGQEGWAGPGARAGTLGDDGRWLGQS